MRARESEDVSGSEITQARVEMHQDCLETSAGRRVRRGMIARIIADGIRANDYQAECELTMVIL